MLRTNSFHHQSLKDVAPGFQATAWADDGVVEAIEAPGEALRGGRAVASGRDVPHGHATRGGSSRRLSRRAGKG